MSELATELRAIGRAINHDEYVDAGVVPLTLAHAADHIEALEAALVDICELVDGYEDVDDGQPNLAMRVMITAVTALAPEQDK